jgi:hypothetical protein
MPRQNFRRGIRFVRRFYSLHSQTPKISFALISSRQFLPTDNADSRLKKAKFQKLLRGWKQLSPALHLEAQHHRFSRRKTSGITSRHRQDLRMVPARKKAAPQTPANFVFT